MTWQNWDNLIDYIKLNLGAPALALEFKDEDLLKILKNHSLPEFSRYIPLMKYYMLTEAENCIRTEPTKIYQIKNFPFKIIKVDEIISKPNMFDLAQTASTALYSGDVTNLLGSNYMLQSKTTVIADDTWTFMAPDKIELIKSYDSLWTYDDFIAKLACIHNDPTTIDPDMYVYLRDLALADIMIYIGRIRTKYQSFNTPVGQIDMPAQELVQEGNQLKREIKDKLERIPPDHYVYFLN